MEFAAPVFHSSLTKDQSMQLELCQKKAFAVILGKNYGSYEAALAKLKLDRLDTRRVSLCLSFAVKCTNSTRHSSMFPHNSNYRTSMRNPKPFLEFSCNTSRYYNSSIPYMSRLLNKKH